MNKILFFCICCSFTLLISCQNTKEEAPKLDENQFKSMLIEIHITDGTLSSQNIFYSGKNFRPSYYYNHIFEKYDVNREQFDSCLSYYSSRTTEFTQMYDQIIDSLNRLETKLRIDVKNEKLERDTVNLWKGKNYFKIPRDKSRLKFSIPVTQRGLYTVKADLKLSKEDQTVKPRMEAYFWKLDSIGDTIKAPFMPRYFISNDKFITYQTQLEYPDSTFTHLKGYFFKGDNDVAEFTQKFELKNIMIFNPQIRPDSTQVLKEIEMQRIR